MEQFKVDREGFRVAPSTSNLEFERRFSKDCST